MTDSKFKENRALIKKRLSTKQRMAFEQLVDRNIHSGLNDELREERPMENIKKQLQLNRKLCHRPQPSDIATDEDLPNDLKRADTEYYKLYEYRDAATPASTPIIDNQNGKIDIIKPRLTKTTSAGGIENPLGWKFGQRSSAKELEIRGIIPEQYADVVHGDKSLDDAKREWEEYKKQSGDKIKNKIDLKFRPSRQDLQDRGIVPDWENPNLLKETKEENIKSLSMKLKQRMDPNEADQRAIINKKHLFSNKDYEEHRKEAKEANKQLKAKMSESLNQRSNKDDIIFRGIVAKEYLDEDVNVAKKKLKEQKISVKEQMNKAFGNRPNKDEIEKLYLQEMNDRGDVLIDIDQLKRQINELTQTNITNKMNWEQEKEIYENEILKYKQQFGNENNNINITSEYERKEMRLNDEISNLKKRINILEENENIYKGEINNIIKSKCKLVMSTSTEIDALRYKIKMYTQGNWNV